MLFRLWCVAVAVVIGGSAHAQKLTVVSISPARNSIAAANTSIAVEFDRPLNPATVIPANFWAFARWSGSAKGTLTLSNGNRTVTLDPAGNFSAGELVTVYLSHNLRGADGAFLRAAGYSFQFWARTQPAAMNWRHIQTMTTDATPSEDTRAYGGQAADLDNDGWLDLTIVCEVSSDLRVFMNRDDGSGTYHPFIQPVFPVGHESSPNESADFNRDGKTDICIGNGVEDTVSVLLGLGDGRYGPQQTIPVGQSPRGIAVLDADGDGDQDIVNTNTGSSNVSRLLNNGAGVFGPAALWEGGGSGEWPLGAADMDEDGILDVVVGAIGNSRMIVNRCNGDGTFTALPSQDAGGLTWQLALGDVNADGHADVLSANSSADNGAVLLGNGAGGLGGPVIYPTDPFCIASDIGDLDGDGDLDWVISCFGGQWLVFRNNGAGVFTGAGTLPATSAASCAIPLDFDNDGDLDLALIDEINDEVKLYDNACYADCNDDQQTTIADFACFQTKFVQQDPYANCDGQNGLSIADFACFQTTFVGGCP